MTSIPIDLPQEHLVVPGAFSISDKSTRAEDYTTHTKATAVDAFKKLRKEFIDWQYLLYAEGKHSLLIVLQAMDAGGKDGTIRNIFKGVNPQGVKVTSFKAPSTLERSHDFLWRIHAATPPIGKIGVFNRSHYEDVLIVRVKSLVPESVWRPRYEHINAFEQNLTDANTHILKFYLHISKEEQKERLQDRLDDPTKNWKFDVGDLEHRGLWPDYMAAFDEALNKTSRPHAPWYAIPADQKWYRNLAIMRILVNKMRDLNPKPPTVTDDLSNIEID